MLSTKGLYNSEKKNRIKLTKLISIQIYLFLFNTFQIHTIFKIKTMTNHFEIIICD